MFYSGLYYLRYNIWRFWIRTWIAVPRVYRSVYPRTSPELLECKSKTTGWLKKVSCILWWIRTIFKFFHCYTQQEIWNKEVITDVTTPKKCHYTTLQNIILKKISSTESTLKSTTWCRADHFFHCDLSLKCSKRRLLENWWKEIAMRDSTA